MRIVMLGTGYVGLVSGACFSDFGHEVVCVDNDVRKIEVLRKGDMPIFEPGLDDLVATNMKAGRLSFTTDLSEAAVGAEAFFIAVGTPSRNGGDNADLTHVYEGAREIASAIETFSVVIVKSTVPVGTGDEIERIIREARANADFAVVSNPEFLREGAAISDFKAPDRIIVGAEDPRARAVMSELYRPLHLNQPLLFTTRRTSELIKYAANAFLAMKITFINEIADLCENVGANVEEVARGIGLDPRIGTKFLHAGPGFGGSCFPKDTRAIVGIAQGAGSRLRLIETVVDVNEGRKHRMVEKIVAACGGSVTGKRIAVLGLTFKPGTDDMRESPSLTVIPALQTGGAKVIAYDPEGMAHAAKMLPGVDFAFNAYAALDGADALVLMTEWEVFRALDLKRVKALMRLPNVIDLRNVYRPEEMEGLGFAYESIGRPMRLRN